MEDWMTPDQEEERAEGTGAEDSEEREPEEGSGQEPRGLEWFLGNIRDCAQFLTLCWAFLMLAVFPVYVIDRYQDIGAYKYSFFSGVSALLLAPGAVLALVCLAGRTAVLWRRTLWPGRVQKGFWPGRAGKGRISALDLCVIAYLLANLISFALSDFKEEAWRGVSGWNMGLKTQLFMIAAYFLISRFLVTEREGRMTRSFRVLLTGALAGSAAVFLLGLLHRFGIDPLGFYAGLDETYRLLFLSTIGQATWYSSYVCTVLPIGLCLFVGSEKRGVRLAAGLYCALGFMTLVTQNSDSAFAALAFLFLGLFMASCGSVGRLERFLEVLILCAGSFKAVGLLQRLFPERAVSLGSLSTAFSQGSVSWLMLLLGAGFYLLLLRLEGRMGCGALQESWQRLGVGRRLRTAAALLTLSALAGVIVFIVLNTTGLLEKWFGISSGNQYLLFQDNWGSSRGFTWKISAEIFAGMPVENKLFGVGPDCFRAYSYSIPAFAMRLYEYWKPNVLTNAHNEYLNLLICIGLAGLLAFAALLGTAARRFSRLSASNPLVLMGLLTVCAYGAHNFFCYQQVCCTPFLFLILGMAEAAARDGFSCEKVPV